MAGEAERVLKHVDARDYGGCVYARVCCMRLLIL
jgi:hypothetical protein